MTFFNFTKNIYLNHRPVLVDDATDTWPAMKKLTVKKLFQVKIHQRAKEIGSVMVDLVVHRRSRSCGV